MPPSTSAAGRGRWVGAVATTRDQLSGEGGDCEDIIVHVTTDGALVVFKSHDGRQAIRAGLHLGGAILNEGHDASPDAPGGAQAEARTALTLDLVVPRRAPWRLRASLGLEAVPSRFGRNSAVDESLPAPPRWAALFSVGVETEAL